LCIQFYEKEDYKEHKTGYVPKNDAGPPNKRIWKAKIPEKIKIFMWLIEQNDILTKDNLLERNPEGKFRLLYV
jgi:hypothetical protein